MRHLLNKFRDPELANRILDTISAKSGGGLVLMEVCGTHTMVIARMAIRERLAGRVELRSGPGCPVCVTDNADLDRMIALAALPNVITATFGDMMRVPGSHSSLQREKARGADVRVVYSPLDALQLARDNPGREVIFPGVGFETTAPAVALSLEQAVAEGVKNFSVFSGHKLTPPAVKALLEDGDMRIDGFICPGHVSAVTGRAAWDFLAKDYGLPAVIAGFEPVDILCALEKLVDLIVAGERRVVNCYTRAVREEGNPRARELMGRYFDRKAAAWRGMGMIPDSGLGLKTAYARYDAEQRYQVKVPPPQAPRGCACGEVLKGKILPPECRLYGKACTPRDPVGPCMVSSEGACAAYYKYGRRGAQG